MVILNLFPRSHVVFVLSKSLYISCSTISFLSHIIYSLFSIIFFLRCTHTHTQKENIKKKHVQKDQTLLYTVCVLFSLSIFNCGLYSISAINISVAWTCVPDPEQFRQLCQIQKKTQTCQEKVDQLVLFPFDYIFTEIIRT